MITVLALHKELLNTIDWCVWTSIEKNTLYCDLVSEIEESFKKSRDRLDALEMLTKQMLQ